MPLLLFKPGCQIMQRVLVIGISGAGKSTFSRALAARTGLPLIHLDQHFHQPGWTMPPRAVWRATVADLTQREAWVMDGNYGSTFDLRMPRADTLIWFEHPRLRCIRRALSRVIVYRGQVRPDMAPGCPERLDLEFIRYIWNFGDIQARENALAIREHGRHLTPVMFRRDSDASAFLASVQKRNLVSAT